MPRVGLEPTTSVLERAKTVHALDRAAGQCDRRAELPNLVNPVMTTIYPSNYPFTPQLTPPKQEVGLTWPVVLCSIE
jgi:hypothetical protein